MGFQLLCCIGPAGPTPILAIVGGILDMLGGIPV
jgi:hypothetical protein